jgi:hypothetical protein
MDNMPDLGLIDDHTLFKLDDLEENLDVTVNQNSE